MVALKKIPIAFGFYQGNGPETPFTALFSVSPQFMMCLALSSLLYLMSLWIASSLIPLTLETMAVFWISIYMPKPFQTTFLDFSSIRATCNFPFMYSFLIPSFLVTLCIIHPSMHASATIMWIISTAVDGLDSSQSLLCPSLSPLRI